MDSEVPVKMLAQEFVVVWVGNSDELDWEKFLQSDNLRVVLKDEDLVMVLAN